MTLLAPDRPVAAPRSDRPAAEPAQADLLIPEARRRQRRRRLAVTGLVITALCVVAIAATRGAVLPRHTSVLSRAGHLPPLGPAHGRSILHIDETVSQTKPAYTWRQETYQQTSPPYLARTIDKRLPGTPPGTEGIDGIGTEELYDPTTNTIFNPTVPKPKPVPGARTPTPAQEADLFKPHVTPYVSLLASGKARVEGRATVDGRAALKITFARSDEIDYVAANGTYAPIETVYGSPSSPGGQTISVYHTFEYLPATRNAGLLSLTAQHPSAKVDTSLRDFRAALSRLLPNG